MKTVAGAVLAAITLAGPPALAGGNPTDSAPKPSSYVSGSHSNRHVYGSPIEPRIVGRATATHHTHPHKKLSSSATTRIAHKAPAHRVEAKAGP